MPEALDGKSRGGSDVAAPVAPAARPPTPVSSAPVASSGVAELTDRSMLTDDSSFMPVLCETCQAEITDEQAENGVVHMAGAYWHMDCFTCITCGRPVPCEQENVLLVGSQPMCGSCTFNCTACGMPITDEVILCGTLTGRFFSRVRG